MRSTQDRHEPDLRFNVVINEDLSWAVDHADVDVLTEAVDSFCLGERFDQVVALRHQCRAALERGLQLWPVAAYCDYRLALDAPGSHCLTGLGAISERFLLGPFAEVVASTHSFSQVRDFLPISPDASAIAHERVIRGEDLTADALAQKLPDVLGLPLALQDWEPDYALAEYLPDRANFVAPKLSGLLVQASVTAGKVLSDPPVSSALRDLVTPWVASSNGVVQVSCVEGNAESAIGSLGLRTAGLVDIESKEALAWMAWAGASGGAQGRRRGAAAGRQQAWWAVRALSGLDDEEFVDADEIGNAASELRWVRWNDGAPDTGWALRLAIEDPVDGLAWVIAALDAK
jgi:Family of unknown function (DUF6183)